MRDGGWFSSSMVKRMPKIIEQRFSSTERTLYESVIPLYSSDPLAYHTSEHIDTLLGLFSRFCPVFLQTYPMMEEEQKMKLRRKLLLAILFHDCVYIPGSPTNEEESADKAAAMIPCLDSSMSKEDVRDISRWILSTRFDPLKPLAPLASKEEEFLHDLDWSGFATPEQLVMDEEKILHEAVQAGFLLIEAQTGRLNFYQCLKDCARPVFCSVLSRYSERAKINIKSRFVEFNRTIE